MMFVTLVKIAPEKNREAYEAIRRLKVPEEIKLVSALGLFGEYDAILIYEAPDEKRAMDFLLNICKITGVLDTATLVATPLR